MCIRDRLSGQFHVPYFGWNLEILALLETVRRTGVAQASRFQIGLDEGGESVSYTHLAVLPAAVAAVVATAIFLAVADAACMPVVASST